MTLQHVAVLPGKISPADEGLFEQITMQLQLFIEDVLNCNLEKFSRTHFGTVCFLANIPSRSSGVMKREQTHCPPSHPLLLPRLSLHMSLSVAGACKYDSYKVSQYITSLLLLQHSLQIRSKSLPLTLLLALKYKSYPFISFIPISLRPHIVFGIFDISQLDCRDI